MNQEEITRALKSGQIGILPTDTIYGLHAVAINVKAVDKIYEIKGREENKPLINLISSIEDLKLFGIEITPKTKIFLERIWPNPVSVILDGTSFRMPNSELLLEILKQTGPLVSTSANPSGQLPATTIEQAKEYFGDRVDFYIDGGKLESEPSTIIRIVNDHVEVLREGSFNLSINIE